MYETNVSPAESLPGAVEFKKYVMSYHTTMSEVGLEVVRLLAMGLGRHENYFDELFLHKPLNTLRLMHYPIRPHPIPEAAKKDGLVLTCLEHTGDISQHVQLCWSTDNAERWIVGGCGGSSRVSGGECWRYSSEDHRTFQGHQTQSSGLWQRAILCSFLHGTKLLCRHW